MEPPRRRFRLPAFGRRSPRAIEAPLDTSAPAGIIAETAPVQAGGWRNRFRAFQHRNYRVFFMGQSISLIGTWMQTIAQGWLVLELTDSKAQLGVVTMLQFLPIMMFVLFAGVVADRVNKRDFLILTQVVAMLQALILAALVITDTVELWHVYVLAFVLGLANAFDMPTRQSFAIEMVGRDDLLNAVALNSSMFNSGRLIGPAIGGVVITVAGVETAFLINGLSFLPVLISLSLIRPSELFAVGRRADGANPLRELREGISYAWRTPSIRLTIILVAMVGMFGYNFTVMLPLIARYVLHEGAAAFGFLTAAVGFGSLFAALMLTSRKTSTRFQMFAGAAAFSGLLACVAVSQNIFLTIAFLVGVGIAGTTFATTANTSIQLASPDHLRGRVVSLYMLLFAGSTPIGGLLMGLIADRFGTQWAIGVFALACGLGTLIGAAYYFGNKSAIERSSEVGRRTAEASA